MQPAKKGIRPVWIVLGILTACLLCCCGGGAFLGFLGYRRGAEVDREAKAYATSAVQTIGKGWSKDEIRSFGSPILTDTLDQPKASFYLTTWRKKLGNLKTLGEFTTGGIFFDSQNGLPAATRVRLSAPATFEKGSGTIVLRVVKQQGHWGIESLDIESETLLK